MLKGSIGNLSGSLTHSEKNLSIVTISFIKSEFINNNYKKEKAEANVQFRIRFSILSGNIRALMLPMELPHGLCSSFILRSESRVIELESLLVKRASKLDISRNSRRALVSSWRRRINFVGKRWLIRGLISKIDN